MSSYYIIDAIQNAKNINALSVVENWINQLVGKHAEYLANLALIRRCELLIEE